MQMTVMKTPKTLMNFSAGEYKVWPFPKLIIRKGPSFLPYRHLLSAINSREQKYFVRAGNGAKQNTSEISSKFRRHFSVKCFCPYIRSTMSYIRNTTVPDRAMTRRMLLMVNNFGTPFNRCWLRQTQPYFIYYYDRVYMT